MRTPAPYSFLVLLLSLISLGFSQSDDYKLMHSSDFGKTLSYTVRFKDHKNTIVEWGWEFDKKEANLLGEKLGFNENVLRPKPSTQVRITAKSSAELERKRKEFLDQQKARQKKESEEEAKIINSGLFRRTNLERKANQETVLIDLNFQEAVSYYKSFALPIKRLVEDTFAKIYKKSPDPLERIKFIMGFIEDIPYGVPPNFLNGKYIGGIFSPPLIFEKGYADCDSKALLFASILSHYPELYKLVVIYQKDHLLLGVQVNNALKNGDFISFKGSNYAYVDAVGPGRLPLGKMAYPKKNIIGIEAVDLKNTPPSNRISAISEPFIKQIGYAYTISLNDEKNALDDFQIDVSTANLEGYYTNLMNMPYSDGKTYFGSMSKILFLHYQKNGYLLLRKFTNEKENSHFPIDINFDEGLKLVSQRPNSQYTLIKYEKQSSEVTSYRLSFITTDMSGNFKAFVEPGDYSILPGRIQKLDGTEKIYYYNGGKALTVTEFREN